MSTTSNLLVGAPSYPSTIEIENLTNTGNIDLSGADVDWSNTVIDASDTTWDLVGSNLNFTGTNLAGLEIRGTMTNASFNGGIILPPTSAMNVQAGAVLSFKNVNLAGSVLNLTGATFVPGLFDNMNFTNEIFTGTTTFASTGTVNIAPNATVDLSNSNVVFPTPTPAGLLPGSIVSTAYKLFTQGPPGSTNTFQATGPGALATGWTFSISRVGRICTVQFPDKRANVTATPGPSITFTGIDLAGFLPFRTNYQLLIQGSNLEQEPWRCDLYIPPNQSGPNPLWGMVITRPDTATNMDLANAGIPGSSMVYMSVAV